MLQGAVVEAGAGAEPRAVRVDGDQRYQNQVEAPDGDARRVAAFRFRNSVAIRSQAGVMRVAPELHAAAAIVDDGGEVQLAAVASSELHDEARVRFVIVRDVD